MKNKWLIVLFIFFLGVIFLSLFITRQSQKAVSLSEEEILITEQAENKVLPAYSSQLSPAPITRLPLAKSAITIIKAPAIAPQDESIRALEITDKAVNNVSSQNVASSAQATDSLQVGITRIGKQPTHKEAQEMNSSGIVLY